MNINDIIYPPLTDILDQIISVIGEKLEQVENEEKQEQYDALMDINDQISEVYAANGGVPCLLMIRDEIGNEQFPTITVDGWDEFSLFLTLASIIESDGDIDREDEFSIEVSKFLVETYTSGLLPFDAFAYFNATTPADSVAYLMLGSPDIEAHISENGFNTSLLALFINLLSNKQDIDLSKSYVIFRNDALSQKAAESSLMVLATANGHVIHRPKNCHSFVLPDAMSKRVSSVDAYSQFAETLVILSEVNERKDILGKFLNLYHVLEGFMFKVPLVNLGASNDGRVFSIRDFRLLFDVTSEKEMNAIKRLFKSQEMGAFWERDISGQKFKEYVASQAALLSSSARWGGEQECDKFLTDLCIDNITKYAQLSAGLNADRYVKLLYKVRCAIVHNKETELHISHFNLNDTSAEIIDSVLIKPLMLLVYDLITDKQSKVWYTGPTLSLYAS